MKTPISDRIPAFAMFGVILIWFISLICEGQTNPPSLTTVPFVKPLELSAKPVQDTNTPTGSVSVTDTGFIPAHMNWESSIGQWRDVGYAVQQGTNLYHMEKTLLSSNLVASIVWQGKTNYCVLESHPIREVTRTFIIEEVKRYTQ